ncbi:SDR family NAD(P)-dependent oxidoreductase [Allokutzneria albata]|uniref:NAD(P)-dependent dehydrogenase, short-chain alcohol dehydrogenase family n=1 Tax=Allokutzneria albata TaxID=211114 RepID=A0A1H0BSV6_ALLAB|nr:SDR family oxidoreductase [Allokutzneria albata]SDN48728.1 NAD(P)-dependent dehydrogenase, short-chain alcohol dehydrogenase family [Allokutzneria albata]
MSARVALVTGAGGGLGRAIALRLAKDGYAIAVLDIAQAEDTVELIERAGGTATPHSVDLRDSTVVENAFDAIGQLDVLVNNAAIYPTRPFVEVPLAEYDEVHAVNQRSYWLAAQLATRRMPATGGSIVNIASMTMHGGWADLAAYVATKGAVVALTKALARELGPREIRVNCVSPGAFPTAAEAIHPDPEAYNEFVLKHQALQRRGTPEELAAVVSFLAGPEASFVTGQTIEVNGGWVMT